MRFSLKWLLACIVYVAIAAAAVGSSSMLLIELVWLTQALAFAYALFVCVASRFRNPFALGFLCFVAGNWAVWTWLPERLPLVYVLYAMGFDVSEEGIRVPPMRMYSQRHPIFQVANLVGTMAAGLIGGALATLAYRRHGKRE